MKKYSKSTGRQKVYTSLNKDLTFLSPDNWTSLLSELTIWMSTAGLLYQSFWVLVTNNSK